MEPPPAKQITVLLAEDRASLRKALKLLVQGDGDIKVIGEVKSGQEAVSLAMHLHPAIVVMDIAMPLLNGLQATSQIMRADSATRVLVLSAHSDPGYVKQAMIYGASGYMLKQSSTPFLTGAIRGVNKGGTYFSSSPAKALCDQARRIFDKGEALRKRAVRVAFSGGPVSHRGV